MVLLSTKSNDLLLFGAVQFFHEASRVSFVVSSRGRQYWLVSRHTVRPQQRCLWQKNSGHCLLDWGSSTAIHGRRMD